MDNFTYYQPTEILFGCGRITEIGQVTAGIGKRCLLVTTPVFPALAPVIDKVKKSLESAGVEVAHFAGVVPNPTTESIHEGAEAAVRHQADGCHRSWRRFQHGQCQGDRCRSYT